MNSSITAEYDGTKSPYDVNHGYRKEIKTNANPDKVLQEDPNKAALHPVAAELTSQYGARVLIKAVPNQTKEEWISQLFGSNHVVADPSIIEKMAEDPKVKEYYLNQVMKLFAENKSLASQLASSGQQVYSSGIVFQEDGKVSPWALSGHTPERAAQVRRQMVKRAKIKAKKRQEQERQEQIAAERYEERERLRKLSIEKMLEQDYQREMAVDKSQDHEFKNMLADERSLEQEHHLMLSFLRKNEQDVRNGFAFERRKLSVDYFKIMK